MNEEPASKEVPVESSSQNFWQELKRRKVVRVAVVYIVTAWIIIQVAATTFPSFGIPDWAMRFVTLLLLLGFPVALVLAWALELTPDGIKTNNAAATDGAQKSKHTFAFGALLSTMILGAIAVFFFIQPSQPGAGIERSETLSQTGGESRVAQSIAVMPLVNMSSVEENEFFAGGIHEDVLTNLSRIENLQVKSRTSMLRYAASDLTLSEIGEELNADYIVEGSVRRIGNHVRVTIQLIDASNENHLWASNFERELIDVFATQSELAKEISNSLHLEIQPESVGTLEGMPTFSVKAYDLYIRAESLEKTEGETEEVMVQRRAMLEEAVVEDPDFVEAWAVLKRLYDLQLDRLRRRDWYIDEGDDAELVAEDLRVRSKRALEKAMALDSDNVETMLSRVVDHVRSKTPAERLEQKVTFEKIIAAHPDNAKAWYFLGFWYSHGIDLPDHDREEVSANAAAAFEEALRLDPFNARMVGAVLNWYRNEGFPDDVTRLSKRLNQIVPETAADRRLARVSWVSKRRQIVTAFLETADESLIEDYRDGWQEGIASGEFSGSISPMLSHWHEAMLSVYSNDLDRIIELSRISFELREGEFDAAFFSILRATAMGIFADRGDVEQAQFVAQSILEQEAVLLERHQYECSCYLGGLAEAYAMLGNADKARELTAELLQNVDLYQEETIRILPFMDVDQAVAVAFAELAKNPNWNGFDQMAAEYIWHADFLTHPTIQEHYVKEGKWVDYLAARVPEYAKYKRASAQ